MKAQPPRKALALLRWFCREDYLEEIEGDLTEVYRKEHAIHPTKAKQRFVWSVITYFRPQFIKSLKTAYPTNNMDMFNNYLKVTLRNFSKQQIYSIINISGLTIGLTCFVLIMLYVQHEFSYDRFYKNSERIYRIYQRQSGNLFLGTDYFAVTPPQLASVLRDEVEGIEKATSIQQRSALLSKEDHHFWENGISGDSHFFSVFPFTFLHGNGTIALSDKKNIVLTQSLSRKLFNNINPIGKTVKYQNETDLVVTGVIKDPPYNSSLQFSYIVNIMSDAWIEEEMKRPTFNNNSTHTFFVIKSGANPADIESQFPALLKKYKDPEGYVNYKFKDTYLIQPLVNMHMTSGVNFDLGIKGSKRSVYLFAGVALIVLLLACINYMNLAVARSITRSREVGLRKVVGAVRRQIIIQFLGESVMIALLSLLLSTGFIYVLLPHFSNMMERTIDFDFTEYWWMLPAVFAVVVIVGLFSGSYPAIIMSSLRPVQVLKGKAGSTKSNTKLQQGLIVIQYAASLILIMSSFIIYKQIKFINEKDLGFEKYNIINIRLRDSSLLEHYQKLSSEWKQNPNILSSCISSHLPVNITSSRIVNDELGGSPDDDIDIYCWRVDHDFTNVFGIELLYGRNFLIDSDADQTSCIINETAASALGWSPQEAVGKQIKDEHPLTIIGVVKDFHMHSMHLPIEPLMIQPADRWASYISLKVLPNNLHETFELLKKSTKQYSPYPFDYEFMDEHFDRLYKTEKKVAEVFGFFTILSIIIAAFGLFGLAAFLTSQRNKEIGIRKVLGASTSGIVHLLTKSFIKLVIIAFILSIPVSWYVMHAWLEDFAYKISIEWWMFGVAGVIALLTAYISVGFQSVKASQVNPVESLKNE